MPILTIAAASLLVAGARWESEEKREDEGDKNSSRIEIQEVVETSKSFLAGRITCIESDKEHKQIHSASGTDMSASKLPSRADDTDAVAEEEVTNSSLHESWVVVLKETLVDPYPETHPSSSMTTTSELDDCIWELVPDSSDIKAEIDEHPIAYN